MKRLETLLATTALALLMEASAFAQAAAQPTINNPSPPLNGGTTPSVAEPTQPNVNVSGFDPYGINRTPWFGTNDLQKELNLTTEQYNDLVRSHNQNWQAYNKAVNGLSNLPMPQQMQRRQALSNEYYSNLSSNIAQTVSDPVERQRYQQLFWQYRAYGAFQDPEVQKQLHLTDAQLGQLDGYGRDWNNRMAGWQRDFPVKGRGISRQFTVSRAQAQQRINSTLTPAQRDIWNNMTGQAYPFRAEIYFGSNAASATNGPSGIGPTTGPNGGTPVNTSPGAAPSSAAPASGTGTGAATGATGGAAPK